MYYYFSNTYVISRRDICTYKSWQHCKQYQISVVSLLVVMTLLELCMSKCHHQQSNIRFFYGCPSSTNRLKALKGICNTLIKSQ